MPSLIQASLLKNLSFPVSLVILSTCLLAGIAHAQPAVAPESKAAEVVKNAKPRSVFLYSTRGDNKMHVVDAADLSLITSHDLGIGAHEFVVSPDGRWAIGSAYGGPGAGHKPADHRLAVFDLKAGKLHRTIDIAPLSRPNDAAFLADSTHAYVTVEAPPRILKVNVESGEHTAITLDRGTNHMLGLSPDAKRLYIAHVMPGGITVIDTATDTVLSHIAVPDGAEGVVVTPDNAKVWVSCNRTDKIMIIDAAKGTIERTIECEGFPFRLRLSPDGKIAAVSLPKSDEVALFDVADPTKVRRVSLRDANQPAKTDPAAPVVPTSIAFAPDGSHLAVVCAKELVLIDIAQAKVVARNAAAGPIADALAAATISMKPDPASSR